MRRLHPPTLTAEQAVEYRLKKDGGWFVQDGAGWYSLRWPGHRAQLTSHVGKLQAMAAAYGPWWLEDTLLEMQSLCNLEEIPDANANADPG